MTYSKLFSILVGAALIFSVQHAEAKGPQKQGEPDGFYECVEGNLGEYSAFCPMSQPGFCPGMEKLLKRTKQHLHSQEKLSKKEDGRIEVRPNSLSHCPKRVRPTSQDC